MTDPDRVAERERKKERNVINTCNKYNQSINQSVPPLFYTVGKGRIIRTFSWPARQAEVLFEFEKICDREYKKRGFSRRIQELITRDVAVHGRGNNQLKLSSYIDESLPSPNNHLCNSSRGHTNDGKIFCTNPSVVPVYEMTVIAGISGQWIQGIKCYSCPSNKLLKREAISISGGGAYRLSASEQKKEKTTKKVMEGVEK